MALAADDVGKGNELLAERIGVLGCEPAVGRREGAAHEGMRQAMPVEELRVGGRQHAGVAAMGDLRGGEVRRDGPPGGREGLPLVLGEASPATRGEALEELLEVVPRRFELARARAKVRLPLPW